MTYYESAEDEVISKERAVQELNKHGVIDTKEFFTDCGNLEFYIATDVLEWLGY